MGNTFASQSDTGASSPKEEEEVWPYVWAMRDPECLDWKRGLTEEEIQTCALRQIDMPVPITQTMYLSDHRRACDVQKLKSLGITHVLNVAGAAARGPTDIYEANDIVYKEVDADDEEGYDMIGKHLEECQLFIKAAASAGGKTVVHCVAGINRSGVIVAAIHLLEEAEAAEGSVSGTVLLTVAHCRLQRSNCFLWNHSFQLQLALFAKKHNLLGPLPGQPGSFCVATAQDQSYDQEKREKKTIKGLF